LDKESLLWWIANYRPEKYHGEWVEKDVLLDAALCVAERELERAFRLRSPDSFPGTPSRE
jgi:hypothetical protein